MISTKLYAASFLLWLAVSTYQSHLIRSAYGEFKEGYETCEKHMDDSIVANQMRTLDLVIVRCMIKGASKEECLATYGDLGPTNIDNISSPKPKRP